MGDFLRQQAKEMQKEVVPDPWSQSLELGLSHMTTPPDRELRNGVFDSLVTYEGREELWHTPIILALGRLRLR